MIEFFFLFFFLKGKRFFVVGSTEFGVSCGQCRLSCADHSSSVCSPFNWADALSFIVRVVFSPSVADGSADGCGILPTMRRWCLYGTDGLFSLWNRRLLFKEISTLSSMGAVEMGISPRNTVSSVFSSVLKFSQSASFIFMRSKGCSRSLDLSVDFWYPVKRVQGGAFGIGFTHLYVPSFLVYQ